jgi:hypothetical protein
MLLFHIKKIPKLHYFLHITPHDISTPDIKSSLSRFHTKNFDIPVFELPVWIKKYEFGVRSQDSLVV